jgi:rhamnosyltransferase
MFNSVLIISHYHKEGIIRSDTLKLIKILKKKFKKIIIVSTKLKKKISLGSNVTIIIKKNVGKDFHSFRSGFFYLYKKKYLKNLSNIYFMNTSFVCMNVSKFMSNIVLKMESNDYDFIGVTKSFEINEHIQTYFFKISKNIFLKFFFIKWVNKIKPLKKRMDIVNKYEIGLSRFLINHGYRCNSIFPNKKRKKIILKILNFTFFKKRFEKGNPTAYLWKKIYKKFGIIKLDLIKNNPPNLNLGNLNKIFYKKKYIFQEIIKN